MRRELSVSLGDPSSKFIVRLLTEGSEAGKLAADVPGRTSTCGDITVPLPQPPWTKDALRVFVDASVIETFIVGREALTSRVYNVTPGKTELQIELTNGDRLEVKHWPLDAISADRLTT